MTRRSQPTLPFEIEDHARAGQFIDAGSVVEVYQTRVEPLVKRILASKLRVSMRPTDDTRQNQDALELMSEIKLLVLPKLGEINNNNSGDDGIRDIDAYVRTITANAFNQYLRRKYPRRLSLKNQFRYLLTHHRNFSLWKDDDDRWLCGLSGSQFKDRPVDAVTVSPELQEWLEARISSAQQKGPGKVIVDFAKSIFEHCERPILFDDLISAAYQVLRIEEPVEVAEPENIADLATSRGKPTALSTIEEKEFVSRLWAEILELPLRHRTALLLNFRDDTGDNLISLLPLLRVASVRQIADALDFAHEEFASIWNQLPWDDNRIARHLGLQRQQVINLRQSARNMLKRKLRPVSGISISE